jgi:hypothetical protein
MAGNRKAAEETILHYIEEMMPGSDNTQMYRNLFASMDDQKFDVFMKELADKSKRLAIVAPNFGTPRLDVKRNLEVGDKLGHKFFERIWIDTGNEMPRYLSKDEYLIVLLPLRRQAQLLVKKISIPEDNKSIDDFTGQPTGKSKGSKISYPETQIMAALNLDNNLTELLKYRGGDIKGFDAMNNQISKTGGVSLKSIEHLGTNVQSTKTLHIFLTSMHIANTGLVH